MALSYQKYLSSLNTETRNEENEWGQHYDMETQILINKVTPLKQIILNHSIVDKLKHSIVDHPNQLKSELYDPESGLKQVLEKYTANQSNQCHYKCKFITSVIYLAHLILFILLFK